MKKQNELLQNKINLMEQMIRRNNLQKFFLNDFTSTESSRVTNEGL